MGSENVKPQRKPVIKNHLIDAASIVFSKCYFFLQLEMGKFILDLWTRTLCWLSYRVLFSGPENLASPLAQLCWEKEPLPLFQSLPLQCHSTESSQKTSLRFPHLFQLSEMPLHISLFACFCFLFFFSEYDRHIYIS